MLGCKVGSLPLSYLGLLVGGGITRLSSWEPLIENIRKKLAAWKSSLLSIGGRLTLIKSSLSNLPIYYMSLFPLPQGVIDKIIQMWRQFLWNGKEDRKALALIRWEMVQLPKRLGGLNVGNLLLRNLGLLFKWI